MSPPPPPPHLRRSCRQVWVIVTSIDPLRIYIMDKTIPKIATLPYDMNKPSNSPPCAAYRMMETQGCKKEGIVKPYPRNAETLGFQRMLRFKTGSNVRQPDWFYHILPKIHRQVAISLMHARDKLLKSHYEIDDEIKYKRFQFLGPDISIDAFGRVRVIDPNPNGFIISGSFFKLHEKLKSAFQIIGIDGFPKSSSGSTLEEINRTVSHFCSQHSCNLKRSSISGPLILQELMHETVHSCGWTRNFPMAEYTKEPFMSLFAKTKLFRETERDHLTMLFVKSKEFKEFAQNQAAGRKKLHSDTIEIVKNTEYYPALSCSNFDADLFNTFLNTTELYEKRLIEERGARKARFCRKKSKPIMHN